MIVYALVGPSGSGKSHHAPLFAYENSIYVIIDDGLLIKKSQVIAGISAKREQTRLGAAKRALMADPEHAAVVQKKIKEINPEKILILGTSRRMIQKITERLEIPLPHHYYSINDLSSKEAIEKALEIRKKENQHVIPLPTFAIKKDFPGYLIAPLRSFLTRKSTENKEIDLERSVVRPIYSSLGNFSINEHAVTDLISYVCDNFPGVAKTNQVNIHSDIKGFTLDIKLTLIYGYNLKKTLVALQQEIKENVEYLTGFYLNKVDLLAQKLHFSSKELSYSEEIINELREPQNEIDKKANDRIIIEEKLNHKEDNELAKSIEVEVERNAGTKEICLTTEESYPEVTWVELKSHRRTPEKAVSS